jgi:hypothetical protein
VSDALRFELSLRILDALLGWVGKRILGSISAALIMRDKRDLASALFRSCDRWVWAKMTSSPFLLMRRDSWRNKRALASIGNDVLSRRLKRSSTAVDTLLTFCPPGPLEQVKDSEISESSMQKLVP